MSTLFSRVEKQCVTCSKAKNECVVEAGKGDKKGWQQNRRTNRPQTNQKNHLSYGRPKMPTQLCSGESIGHRNPPQPTSKEVANQGLVRETHQPCNGGVAGHGLGRVTHQPCSGEVAGQGLGQENQCLVCPC